MPKYYEYKVCGYYLYYTSHCIIEAMHVHASDRKLTEAGSAKFFVKKDGGVLRNFPPALDISPKQWYNNRIDTYTTETESKP